MGSFFDRPLDERRAEFKTKLVQALAARKAKDVKSWWQDGRRDRGAPTRKKKLDELLEAGKDAGEVAIALQRIRQGNRCAAATPLQKTGPIQGEEYKTIMPKKSMKARWAFPNNALDRIGRRCRSKLSQSK
jgi:hypothetical protein